MTFSTVALSIYLLFPIFNPQQDEIAAAFGRKALSAEEKETVCSELKLYLGLYDNAEADGAAEEGADGSSLDASDVPLPGGLENPEYGPQSEASSLVSNEDGVSAAEKQYLNSQNRLRLFEYGEEQFTTNKDVHNKHSIISVNATTFTRTRYDDSYRVIDSIVFNNGGKAKEPVIVKKTTYEYSTKAAGGNERKSAEPPPEYQKPSSMLVEIPAKNQSTEIKYDGNGNPVTVEYAHYTGQDDSAPDDAKTKKIIDRSTVRTYDNSNRLIVEEETNYFSIPDPLRRGKTKPSSYVKKNVYEYTSKAKVPDFTFYEDGVIRMTTKYKDDDTYEEVVYFDNDYKVKTKYEHGNKVEELLYSGSTEVKRQKFEE